MDTIVDWVLGLMTTLGPAGAGLAVALENVFPPIPSEVVLPLAGFTAAQGRMSLVAALVATTAGAVVGALILYWVGASLGLDRVLRAADRIPLVRRSDIERTHAWFTAHGRFAVLVGRCVPVVRSLISIPAGINRMPLGRFTAFTALGSAVWNTALITAGYLLGAKWEAVEGWLGTYQAVIWVGAGAVLAWFVVHRVRQGSDARDS